MITFIGDIFYSAFNKSYNDDKLLKDKREKEVYAMVKALYLLLL